MAKEKFFLLCLAALIIVICATYFFCVTFLTVPESGKRYADIILGALIGSGFTGIISYYWGSSSGSAAKSEFIQRIPEPPTGPMLNGRIIR